MGQPAGMISRDNAGVIKALRRSELELVQPNISVFYSLMIFLSFNVGGMNNPMKDPSIRSLIF